MESPDSSPAVLLHHDGELADVRRLLDELGAPYVERLGASAEREHGATWDVIIASASRMLRFRAPLDASKPTMIAILDGESRTLRAHLRRIRVDLLVRRPVHPAALRLLLLHTLYRGPERRRLRRVSVGSEVRFRAGMRRRTATLTELSVRGCRLLARHPVARGRRIKLTLPTTITGGRPLVVKGTVIRSCPASSQDPGLCILGIRFGDAAAAVASRLQEVLDAHATGPAMMTAPLAAPAEGEALANDLGQETAVDEETASVPDVDAYAHVHEEPPEEAEPEPEDPSDRRRDQRRSYDRRVVALGEEATRVLLGRDISVGGMRVEGSTGIALGDRLRLALHGDAARAEPLVVDAEVLRDDEADGLVLRFEEPAEATRCALGKLISQLPAVADGTAGDEGAGVMISEIIDRHAS